MKGQRKKFLQLRLPADTVEAIVFNAEQKALTRGSMSRLYLVEALEIFSKNALEELSFTFNRPEKQQAETTMIAFEITEQINEKLIELCRYFPVSKKKLAEILICQQVAQKQILSPSEKKLEV